MRAALPGIRRAALFSSGCSVLALASSWYMLEVCSRVVDTRDRATLVWLTVAVLLAYALYQTQERGKGRALDEARRSLEHALAERAFQVGVLASLAGRGAVGMAAMQDLHTLGRFVRSAFVQALCDVPAMFVALVLLFVIHPYLGAVALLVAAVQVFSALAAERIGGRLLLEANEQGSAAQLRAERFLQAAPAAHAMGALGGFLAGWQRQHDHALQLQERSSRALSAGYAATRFLQSATASGLLGLSAWMLLQDRLEGGSAMLVISGIIGGRAVAPIVQAASAWPDLVNALRAWQRLDSLLAEHPEPADGMRLPQPAKGSLSVEQATLTTAGGTTLLRDLRFALEPGSVLAVLGASGAGKTTLARLLVGALSCTRGSVRLGGAEIAGWNKEHLGPHLGYLPQGIEVLDGSLADNVARFGPRDDAAVLDALRLVGLDDWVLAQPDGLDTRVGPQGAFLSGGLRQRLALARACYRQPALLVLDEPDAYLDDSGEAALVRAVGQLQAAGSIVVCVTHRRALVSASSHLLVLSGGAQAVFGTTTEVLAGADQAAPGRPKVIAKA